MKAARLIDGKLHDVHEIPEGFGIEHCFVEEAGFIEVPDDAFTGGILSKGKCIHPPASEPKWTTDTLRQARDAALRHSDWSQLPDVPEDVREAYKIYRQELRDLPSKYPDPSNAVLPEPPK